VFALKIGRNFIGFYFKRILSVSTIFSLWTVLLITSRVWAAVPSVEWEIAFGGSQSEKAYSVQQTRDGGYIVAGNSMSNDGDVSGSHGKADVWVVKLSESGKLVWQKSFGGSEPEVAYSIQETMDGGYILAGYSYSSDGDVSEKNHGHSDVWVIKLKEDGILDWQKSLGGSGRDYANSIQQTMDGGYILAGVSKSNDGDVSGNHGDTDIWIVKLKRDGALEWQKSLGGSRDEFSPSIRQTKDGGYILAGISGSNDGDVSGNHGRSDFWVVKLKENGNIDWQKSLGGSRTDSANSVCQAKDGGYVIAGSSQSHDGDVSENQGMDDLWIVKLKENGIVEWQKLMGGSGIERANSIQPTQDGGYIVTGDVQKERGKATDFWVIKLKEDGTVNWERRLGGSKFEKAYSIQQTREGGYIVAGLSQSDDGDVYKNQGEEDVWVVKLEKE
jgi:hypothetical protein